MADDRGREAAQDGAVGVLNTGGRAFSTIDEGEGPLVLCLHGFPDDNRTFKDQVQPLVQAGFRVVCPMMRGYEPSSQSTPARGGSYYISELTDDVLGWMNALNVQRAHLLGHDWGAITAMAAAARAPERFRSLTTIAVPHVAGIARSLWRRPEQLAKSWYIALFQLRALSEAAVRRDDFALLERLWRLWSPEWKFDAADFSAVRATFETPGVCHAALTYYRCLFRLRTPEARRTRKLLFAPIAVRTLALTGAQDGCLDTRLYDLAMRPRDFDKGIVVERFDDAGHFVHREQSERFNQLLLRWLADDDVVEPGECAG